MLANALIVGIVLAATKFLTGMEIQCSKDQSSVLQF